MFDPLAQALGGAKAAMDDINVDELTGDQPAELIDVLLVHERAVAALRLAAIARFEQNNQWRHEGFDSLADWLAAHAGTSKGKATQSARSARQLRDRHKTANALADGQISEDEADTIADAADKNPAAEQDLLDTAKNKNRSNKDLKDKAAKAKTQGESDQQRAARLRKGRRACWRRDRDGHWSIHAKLQPEVGAEMQNHLDQGTDRILALNRQAGVREDHAQYRADALAAAILGRDPATVPHPDNPGDAASGDPEPAGGSGDPGAKSASQSNHPGASNGAATPEPTRPTGPAPAANDPDDQPSADVTDPDDDESDKGDQPDRTEELRLPEPAQPATAPKEIVLVVDLAAYRRGCVNPGETCEIRGIGPVPVEVARQWADDAFIKTVICDGTNIHRVHHFGRTINTHLRTALDLLEPNCAVPRCDNPRLEYHHLQPHADGGATSFDNLSRLCTRCHDLATHGGYTLAGTPGNRIWINPDGIIEQADNPELVGRPPPDRDPPGEPRSKHRTSKADRTKSGLDPGEIEPAEAFDQLILT